MVEPQRGHTSSKVPKLAKLIARFRNKPSEARSILNRGLGEPTVRLFLRTGAKNRGENESVGGRRERDTPPIYLEFTNSER